LFTMVVTVLAAYFDILKDVRIISGAQAYQVTTQEFQYKILYQEIQELKAQLARMQEQHNVNHGKN
jgi:uncharacterized protein YlbG (UPF0298 family)